MSKAQFAVPAIRSTIESLGKADAFKALGFKVEYARDAFVRYAMESATVISF